MRLLGCGMLLAVIVLTHAAGIYSVTDGETKSNDEKRRARALFYDIPVSGAPLNTPDDSDLLYDLYKRHVIPYLYDNPRRYRFYDYDFIKRSAPENVDSTGAPLQLLDADGKEKRPGPFLNDLEMTKRRPAFWYEYDFEKRRPAMNYDYLFEKRRPGMNYDFSIEKRRPSLDYSFDFQKRRPSSYYGFGFVKRRPSSFYNYEFVKRRPVYFYDFDFVKRQESASHDEISKRRAAPLWYDFGFMKREQVLSDDIKNSQETEPQGKFNDRRKRAAERVLSNNYQQL